MRPKPAQVLSDVSTCSGKLNKRNWWIRAEIQTYILQSNDAMRRANVSH